MGLSQVYGFVKSVGGHVDIESEVGLGTTVALFLPKSSDPVQAEVPANPLPLRAARGTETVLAVEDDEEVLELTVTALKNLGYTVLTAGNAGDALKILSSEVAIELLFSDVIMPGGMNGAQLAVEARRARPGLKILLTSGYTAEALAQKHGIPDDLEVLGKPYRHEELAHKLRLVMTS
jgi:CheY-like chemotaxis protein